MIGTVVFCDDTLDAVSSLPSAAILIGHTDKKARRCHVVHVARCNGHAAVVADLIADATDSLPPGLSVVGVAGPRSSESSITEIARPKDASLMVLVGSGEPVTATVDRSRVACIKGKALRCATVWWYRPPHGLTGSEWSAVLKSVVIAPREADEYVLSVPPFRGMIVGPPALSFVYVPDDSNFASAVLSAVKQDLEANGLKQWLWVRAKPFNARFDDDGSTAGEISVAMRDTFGIKVRVKDVNRVSDFLVSGEPTSQDVSAEAREEDVPAQAKAIVKDARAEAAATTAAPKHLATSQGWNLPFLIVLACVFLGAIALVVMS